MQLHVDCLLYVRVLIVWSVGIYLVKQCEYDESRVCSVSNPSHEQDRLSYPLWNRQYIYSESDTRLTGSARSQHNLHTPIGLRQVRHSPRRARRV